MGPEVQRSTVIVAAADVTDEIIQLAWSIADGWYQGRTIDWGDLLDRLDQAELSDGTVLELGEDMLSPAIMKIKLEVRKMRRESS